jgi:probable phosphoglycerate mutase
MNKTLYILRHGETELNKKHIVQGSGVDSSLNDTGRQQAQAFFEQYQHLPFETILTSKLVRTHETVAPFLQKGINWEQHADINEMGWGVHEGKHNTPEMHQDYRHMMSAWQAGDYHAKLEQGESAHELAHRMGRFIEHLKTRPEKLLLVCSHGRAMRCMVTLFKNMDLKHMEQFHHSNTGLYVVHYQNGDFVFELENDVRHLSELETMQL